MDRLVEEISLIYINVGDLQDIQPQLGEANDDPHGQYRTLKDCREIKKRLYRISRSRTQSKNIIF